MKSNRFLFAILLIGLLAVPAPALAQVNDDSVNLVTGWWDANYRFRRPLAITNNLASPQSAIPIFTFVEVEKGSVFSSREEFRIVIGDREVPSYIIYEKVDDGLVTGVYLFLVIDLLPLETTIAHIYYGYADAVIPEYRTGGGGANLPVSLNFDESDQRFEIDFGDQYGHSFSFMLRDAATSFSSADLNGESFDIISEWGGLGQLPSSLGGGRIVLGGRSLVLVMTGVWTENTIWLSSFLINTGFSGTGLTSLTGLFDFSDLISIGSVEGYYDTFTNTFQVGVTGTWFGIASRDPIRSFDIAGAVEARELVASGSLQGRREGMDNVAIVASRNIGFLSPGEHRDELWFWNVAGSRDEARLSAIDMRRGVSAATLSLEVPDSPIPTASILYRTTLQYLNSSFPSEGFDVTLDSKGAKIIESWSKLEGEISYTVPNLAASEFENGNDFWIENRERQESGVAYSSASHLSLERGHIGRLWAISGEEGSANVSLISQPIILDGLVAAAMNFTYLSSYSARTNASGMFVLNLDYDDDQIADEMLVLPIEGLNYSLSSPVYAFLVPDGIWTNVHIDLKEFLVHDKFTAWIEIQVNVTQGVVELNLDNFSLLVRGDASKVMIATPSSEGVRVQRIGTESIGDILGDINIGFQAVSSKLFSGGPEGRFQVDFSTLEIEQTADSLVGINMQSMTEPYFVLIHTSRPASIERISINEQRIAVTDVIRLSGLAVIEKSFLDSDNNSIKLEYIFGRLRVEARDVVGEGAGGVLLIVRDIFGREVTRGLTSGDGSASLQIAPSIYDVELLYHNQSIGLRRAVIESDVTLRAEVQLFQVRLRVLDRFGQPVDNAKISLLLSNSSVAEDLTGSNGIAIFDLVGQRDYSVLVQHSGEVIYESAIRSNIHGATLDLVTAIIPGWITNGVIIVVVLSLALVGFYIVTRRGL